MHQFPDRKTYTEKEVAKILKLAAEIQEQSGYQGKVPQGSTTTDIEKIGSEVGIDPKHIAAAIEGLRGGTIDESQTKQVRWLGAPEEYSSEQTVAGELNSHTWGSIVGILNTENKQSIEGKQSGGYHTWHWKHDLGSVHVSAIQASDGVRLKFNYHIDDGIVVGLIPTVIAGFAGVTILFSADALRPWLSILLSAAYAVGLALAFRRAVSTWWHNDRKKSSKLVKELIETVWSESTPVMLVAKESLDPEIQVQA